MSDQVSVIQKLKEQVLGGRHWTTLSGQARKEYLELCKRERMALISTPYRGIVTDPNLYKNQFVRD